MRSVKETLNRLWNDGARKFRKVMRKVRGL